MHKIIEHAKDLPKEWDEICKDNIYMSKSFMEFMEKANPCKQSYHLVYDENGKLDSCFQMFERRFNLFIFTKIKFVCKIKFIYLPLSVSHPSVVFGKNKKLLEDAIKEIKGLKLLINIKPEEELDDFAKGHYLPICVLENKWKTFDEYLNSLRSNYRRRINQALKKGSEIEYEILKDNSLFTEEMYGLYEEVFNHSAYSLEKLSLDFFRNDIAKTMVMKAGGKIQAFAQIIEDRRNDMLIFEFIGYNYEDHHKYDTYCNMLAKMTEYAIDNNFKYLQFGQTAYDAKLKFGAKMYYNYFFAHHSNKLINKILHKIEKKLEYKVEDYDFNVFKDDEDK